MNQSTNISNPEIFEGIGKRLRCVRPGDNYVELDITNISIDIDRVKQYFDIDSTSLHYDSEAGSLLKGRIADNSVFSYLMAQYYKETTKEM